MNETVKQLIKNTQPSLKYFTEPSSKLDEKKFKEILYKHLSLQNHEFGAHKEKIDQIVREGYQDYYDTCELVSKGMYYVYRIYYCEENGKLVAHTLQYLAQNKLKLSKYKEICYSQEEGKLKPVREFESPKSYQKFERTGGDLGLVICRFQFDNNHIQLLSPEKYDMPCFTGGSITAAIGDNTQLMMDISNSNSKRIGYLINQTKNINKYNLRYGNNPILLSIAKGYNHANTEHKGPQPSLQQKNIINKLLEREDLDINCIHLGSGMTPLHIACLRGDSSELIQKLLDKGADLNAVDYYGNKPNDLLSYSYEEVQIIIQNMTGNYKFGGKEHSYIKLREDQSYTATLPTREERESNIQEIRKILSKNRSREKEQSSTNSSTIGKPLATKINSLQIEAKNSVER